MTNIDIKTVLFSKNQTLLKNALTYFRHKLHLHFVYNDIFGHLHVKQVLP